MAARSSVTWTHCSVRYKVILGINRRVHVEAGVRLQKPERVRVDASYVREDPRVSSWTKSSVRANVCCICADATWSSLPPPHLLTRSIPPVRPHGRAAEARKK
jgi:hypothetical protein